MLSQRSLSVILWILFFVLLLSALVRPDFASTGDLGRHLRLGEAIVRNNPPGMRLKALTTNFLTYTNPDYPFVNHHWGSEVIFYLTYRLGGFKALMVLKIIVFGAIFFLTALHVSRVVRKRQEVLSSPISLTVLSIGMLFLSVQMMANRLTIRPEMFAYFLFVLLFWLLDADLSDRRFPLFLASCSLIIIVWTNLHISFIYGLLLICLWAVVHITKRPLAVISVVVASILATLFNPNGLRGALMPFSILKDYGYPILENMSPFFLMSYYPQIEYIVYAFLLSTACIFFFLTRSLPSRFHLAIVLIFSFFPLIAIRHLPFFALMVPVVLVPMLLASTLFNNMLTAIPAIPILLATGLAVAASVNPFPLAFVAQRPIRLDVDHRYDGAAMFVTQHKFHGHLWNNYDIGSFLEWTIPEHPVFVDGRPEAFPPNFFREIYTPMQRSQEVWDEKVDEYGIGWAVVATSDLGPGFEEWWKMIQHHEAWRIVYQDDFAAVLVRNDGPNGNIKS